MLIASMSWLVLTIVLACMARNMGRSFVDYFFISLFLSPIIGFIILAIKGKPTDVEKRQELLSKASHIYYCRNCDSTFSGDHKVLHKCPTCNIMTDETMVLTDEWRMYNDDRKAQMKKAFAHNQYLVSSEMMPPPISIDTPSAVSSADELKKFKDLLDAGAITQDEFDAKKKQLLN